MGLIMRPQHLPQATPGGATSRSRAHVVYDAATGTICHVHHTVEFEGGAPQPEAPEDRARRLCGAGAGFEVIEVEPDEVNHRRPLKVDPATRSVVPL